MAKIEKNRPLPSHTKLNYDECYAKIILEMFLPGIYSNLQLSDKPDLRDVGKNTGVEVTSAIPRREQEALSLACEIPYLEEKAQNKRISYLKKIGYSYSKYGMTHPPRGYMWIGWDNPDVEITFCKDFLDAVKAKIEKLNSGKYELLKQYDLFVISELYIEDWMPECLLEKLISYKSEKLNYSRVYLLALNGLFVFELNTNKWWAIDIQADRGRLSMLARQMVEEGENDDKT